MSNVLKFDTAREVMDAQSALINAEAARLGVLIREKMRTSDLSQPIVLLNEELRAPEHLQAEVVKTIGVALNQSGWSCKVSTTPAGDHVSFTITRGK
jgi:hypothetical protein